MAIVPKLSILNPPPLHDNWWKIEVNCTSDAPSGLSYIWEGSKNILLETGSRLSFYFYCLLSYFFYWPSKSYSPGGTRNNDPKTTCSGNLHLSVRPGKNFRSVGALYWWGVKNSYFGNGIKIFILAVIGSIFCAVLFFSKVFWIKFFFNKIFFSNEFSFCFLLLFIFWIFWFFSDQHHYGVKNNLL